MAKEVKLPQLGQTMEEGTIVNCLVKPGSEVKKGDVLFEIETDKATLEMESPADGFVKHILVTIGQTLAVGTTMLLLGEKEEEISIAASEQIPDASNTTIEIKSPDKTDGLKINIETKHQAPSRILATPRAKKLAIEMGIDLAAITGTGPAGKITEDDVKNAGAQTTPQVAQPVEEIKLGVTVPLTKKQRITAERMVESKKQIPCFYLNLRVDMTNLVDLRNKLNETGSIKISYNDFIIRAVAIALEKFPIMTGQLAASGIKLADTINVGLAVSTTGGLIVPVVNDAHKKTLKQIAEDIKLLVEKAKTDKLLLTDLEGACITVSNLGSFGIESFIPIVIPGQCSILGIGKITETFMPDNQIHKLMNLNLSVDHKVANGDYAAQFLDFVRKLLEDITTFV